MPLGFAINRTLLGRSDRVKSVEIHPTEPWVLAGLYNGHVYIWNYNTGLTVRTFEVAENPIRCVKFVARKKWIIAGADDMIIRVYNYNTHEKVHEWEAHTDYIRSITVHPTLPYVLTSSDDMSIKLWDWDKNWENSMIFEGHTHYVMQIEINPKESNTFASASLDRSICIWGLQSVNPHFKLEGHERGVNCVSYYQGGDRPFLVSGADDNLVKVWDYQTKTCVATLEGHTSNVSAVAFHPNLPIILSGSEDNTVRIWHASTYAWEDTLNYSMERCWSVHALPNSNKVALGYDNGTIMITLGQEEPAASMDRAGKITFTRGNELFRKVLPRKGEFEDGEILTTPEKDLISTDVFPQTVKHNCKGTFLAVCGDGEYTVYTALKLSNKAYGAAKSFVWSSTSPDTYATWENKGKLKLFKKFKEKTSIRPGYSIERIFGGQLLGVTSDEFIDFYDWSELRLVRRIGLSPHRVYWSDTICVLAAPEEAYVLEYNEELIRRVFNSGAQIDEDEGIENAFEVVTELHEKITSGGFEGDVFFYTTKNGRLNYLVGEKTITLAHLDKPFFLLGYFNKTNRVYLMNKNHDIISYSLQLEILAYQSAIVREDFEMAEEHLESIPQEEYTKLARFLEQNGHNQLALNITQDTDHKFELALSLKQLELAKDVLEEAPSSEKWRQLTDVALVEFEFNLAIECARISNDFQTLLLIYSSLGMRDGIKELGHLTKEAGRFNISFMCFYLTHQVDECLQLLLLAKRFAEAAMFARSFRPSQIDNIVELWTEHLGNSAFKHDILTSPGSQPQLWEKHEQSLLAETVIQKQDFVNQSLPAERYPLIKDKMQRDLFAIDLTQAAAQASSPPSQHEDAVVESPQTTEVVETVEEETVIEEVEENVEEETAPQEEVEEEAEEEEEEDDYQFDMEEEEEVEEVVPKKKQEQPAKDDDVEDDDFEDDLDLNDDDLGLDDDDGDFDFDDDDDLSNIEDEDLEMDDFGNF